MAHYTIAPITELKELNIKTRAAVETIAQTVAATEFGSKSRIYGQQEPLTPNTGTKQWLHPNNAPTLLRPGQNAKMEGCRAGRMNPGVPDIVHGQ